MSSADRQIKHSRIIQIIPAPGWEISYSVHAAAREGDISACSISRDPLVGWALVEEWECSSYDCPGHRPELGDDHWHTTERLVRPLVQDEDGVDVWRGGGFTGFIGPVGALSDDVVREMERERLAEIDRRRLERLAR